MANYDLTYEGSRVQGILDTGDELRDAGYIFRGEATPSTVPGTPTERVAYIGGPGTYTNFGSSITVGAGCICIFKYTGSAWSNQVINTGLSDAISSEATTRSEADTALQNAINAINNNIGNGYVYAGVATPSTSPVTGKVFYLAVTAGTYTNFGNAVVTAGLNVLKKNGSAWSVDQVIAIDADPTQGSDNLVKSGGVLKSIIQNGPAFDLSAYNAEGGVLATYADLSAALTALNALPADFKKGGMSFRFVQTSDNKYVQARCMAQNFTTDVTKWINIEDALNYPINKTGFFTTEQINNLNNHIYEIQAPFSASIRPEDNFLDKAFTEEHLVFHMVYSYNPNLGPFFLDIAKRYSDGAIKVRYSNHDSEWTENWIDIPVGFVKNINFEGSIGIIPTTITETYDQICKIPYGLYGVVPSSVEFEDRAFDDDFILLRFEYHKDTWYFDVAYDFENKRTKIRCSSPSYPIGGLRYYDWQEIVMKDSIGIIPENVVNLLDFSQEVFTPGYYDNNGVWSTQAAEWGSTGFLPVREGEIITLSNIGWMTGFDENKQFVSYIGEAGNGQTNKKFIIGTGIRYINCAVQMSLANTTARIIANRKMGDLVSPERMRNRYIAFGDSITEGYISGNWQTGPHAMMPYPEYIAKMLNLDVTNKSVGGQGWFRDNNSSGKTGSQEVMSTDLSGYDLITISFGINDYMANDKSISEISTKVREVLSYVFTNNPFINCILVGPINYFGVGDASTKYARNYNNGLYTLEELNTALKTVADEFSVPFVDPLHEFNVNGINKASILQDNLHLNNKGYYMLGSYMCGKINGLYQSLFY